MCPLRRRLRPCLARSSAMQPPQCACTVVASGPAEMVCKSACVELNDAIAKVAGWFGWSYWFESPARLETAVRQAIAVGVLEQDKAIQSAMSKLSAADAEHQ